MGKGKKRGVCQGFDGVKGELSYGQKTMLNWAGEMSLLRKYDTQKFIEH